MTPPLTAGLIEPFPNVPSALLFGPSHCGGTKQAVWDDSLAHQERVVIDLSLASAHGARNAAPWRRGACDGSAGASAVGDLFAV